MPGKKKKSKPNAFFTYMQAMKPLVEKKLGHTIPYEELTKHVGPEWQRMSPEEKSKFNQYKTHIPLDCFGVPLAVHQEIAERAQIVKENMLSGIHNLVDLHVAGNALRELEVVVLAVTEYIETHEGLVIPAEVSLVRATLGDGLDPKQYHAILNPPASWPLGYNADVRARSKETHQLPVERKSPDCVGTDHLDVVAGQMLAFLTKEDGSDELLPVYTLDERLDISRTVLKDTFNMEYINVWSLEALLREVFVSLYPSLAGSYTNAHARDELVLAPNCPNHHLALGCKWHREESPSEVSFCSLNMAQRWGYMLLQALNVDKTLGVTLVEGRHTPGPYPSQAVVVQLSQHQRKKEERRRLADLHSRGAAGPLTLDAAIDYRTLGARPRTVKDDSRPTAVLLNVGPFQPRDYSEPLLMGSTEEFPALGAPKTGKMRPQQQHKQHNGAEDGAVAAAGRAMQELRVNSGDTATEQRAPGRIRQRAIQLAATAAAGRRDEPVLPTA